MLQTGKKHREKVQKMENHKNLGKGRNISVYIAYIQLPRFLLKHTKNNKFLVKIPIF